MNGALPGAPGFAQRSTLVTVLLTAAVFVLTVVAIGSRPDGSEWSVWRPGSGVAVGVAAWYSDGRAPQMAAAAGVGNFFGALVTGRDPWLCFGTAITAALEAWIAARVLQGRGRRVPVLGDTRGLRRLFSATLSVGVVTAVCLGVTAALVLGWDQVGPTLLANVPSHVSGVLLVAPLFFASPPRSPSVSLLEMVIQWTTVAVAVLVVFALSEGLPITFLMLPPLIWGATRSQYRPFVVQLILASLAISTLTSNGSGPFAIDELAGLAPLMSASLNLAIAVMAFTLIASSARARGLRALLDAQALVQRESIEFSAVGIGVVTESQESLLLTDLNAASKRVLGLDSVSAIAVSEVFTTSGEAALRAGLHGVDSDNPVAWSGTLLETRSGRLLEASLVNLTGLFDDEGHDRRASLQFIDKTDREVNRALKEAELERAAEIQRALTPQLDVAIPHYQFAARSAPAQAIGGDFYDFRGDADSFSLSLGDVMGKGVGAALVASALRMSLRLETAEHSPAAALARSARAIESELSAATMFATVFAAHVDVHTGHVQYVDAGHGLAVICRDDALATQLDSRGLPLGVVANSEWGEKTAQLDPGDTLVVFSDGLLDLFDGSLNVFSEIVRVSRLCNTVEEVLDQLFSGLDAGTISDDVTAIAIRREVSDAK